MTSLAVTKDVSNIIVERKTSKMMHVPCIAGTVTLKQPLKTS